MKKGTLLIIFPSLIFLFSNLSVDAQNKKLSIQETNSAGSITESDQKEIINELLKFKFQENKESVVIPLSSHNLDNHPLPKIKNVTFEILSEKEQLKFDEKGTEYFSILNFKDGRCDDIRVELRKGTNKNYIGDIYSFTKKSKKWVTDEPAGFSFGGGGTPACNLGLPVDDSKLRRIE